MGNANDWIPTLLFIGGFALLILKHREVREAIENFRDNFPRGGPGTPMHPSPAGDDALLRHRRTHSLAERALRPK